MMGNVLSALTGLSAGIISGGALCALYISLGVLAKTSTSLGLYRIPKVAVFSSAFGGVIAILATIFGLQVRIGAAGIILFGLFGGMFIGIIIGCIADIVSSISIIKNLGISNKSIAIIVGVFGLGKLLGSMVFWLSNVF